MIRCESLQVVFDSLWLVVYRFWLIVSPCKSIWTRCDSVLTCCESLLDSFVVLDQTPRYAPFHESHQNNSGFQTWNQTLDNFIEPRSILKQFCIWLVEVGNANKQLSISKKNLFYVQDFNDWNQTVIFLNFKFRRSWFPLSQEYHFAFRFSKCFTVCHTYKKIILWVTNTLVWDNAGDLTQLYPWTRLLVRI